jgi:stage II sporulation protein D
MPDVRIGFLHRRQNINLLIPEKSTLHMADQELAIAGILDIELSEKNAATTTRGLKILESANKESISLVSKALLKNGFKTSVIPFSPGYKSENVYSPKTELLVIHLPDKSVDNDTSSSHMELDISKQGQDLLRKLGPLLAEFVTPGLANSVPDLWHLQQPAGFNIVLKNASSRVNLKSNTGNFQDLELPLKIKLPPGQSANVGDVEVGIGFHWQHQTALEYVGALSVHCDVNGLLCLVNELEIDTYLASVNSSEMTADSPLELLKAQTVAARSTLLATRGRHHNGEPFDICADDHCQCFRGSGTINSTSLTAARETSSELLTWNRIICDARYSKSCGGIVEAYENVWEDLPVEYLTDFNDTRSTELIHTKPSIRNEKEWVAWIDKSEDVWCNTEEFKLPEGLRYCDGYYRWQVEYSRAELTEIICAKCGLDFDHLIGLQPVSRGKSGRLVYLKIITDRGDFVIGKELRIRLALSKSCLFSSAIWFEWVEDQCIIHGKGWGHGVGMCQLGATRMAFEGNDYRSILNYYYPATEIQNY